MINKESRYKSTIAGILLMIDIWKILAICCQWKKRCKSDIHPIQQNCSTNDTGGYIKDMKRKDPEFMRYIRYNNPGENNCLALLLFGEKQRIKENLRTALALTA